MGKRLLVVCGALLFIGGLGLARLCAMVNDARVATTKTVRLQALAFHPTGWLAAKAKKRTRVITSE